MSRYSISQLLHSGPHSAVYAAWDNKTRQTIALKQSRAAPKELDNMMRSQGCSTESVVSLTSNILVHPEDIEGDTDPFHRNDAAVALRLLGDPAPRPRCITDSDLRLMLPYFCSIASIENHACLVSHGDVNFDNFLLPWSKLSSSGEITSKRVLCDLASAVHPATSEEFNATVKKLQYVAPEIRRMKYACYTSDAWSLGVMLHKAFHYDTTGKHDEDDIADYGCVSWRNSNAPRAESLAQALLDEDPLRRITSYEAIKFIN
ncbi:protein kinase [Tetraselmis virus 1]|uniref:Protein kinase n=1 Tax=Tetraselmis virus 1 TaxID=2060617 RepID=A0A2P0VMI7_9VIRU|nr:protein kinase [Tetraselmis virus 1]AUF82112.1 protein kinase [Tetraselmis virus 1]